MTQPVTTGNIPAPLKQGRKVSMPKQPKAPKTGKGK